MALKVNDFGEYADDGQGYTYDDPTANLPDTPAPAPAAPAPAPSKPTAAPAATAPGPTTGDYPAVPPTAGYDRQKFQDAWGASAGHSTADLDALIKAHPEYATGITGTGDKRTMPGYVEPGTGIYRGPENLDLIGDVGGANTFSWGGYGPGSAGYGDPASAVGGSAGAGAGGSGSGMSAGTSDAMHAALLQMLQRGSSPVTPESMADQFNPVDRQFQRAATRSREQAAERLAFTGENNGGQGGALDTTVNSINEDMAGKEGALMAQLTGSELQARRDDVNNALQFAQGEEKIQLQLQLAEMDKQLRLQGMNNQNTQFYDNMGYNIGRDEYIFGQGNVNTLPSTTGS